MTISIIILSIIIVILLADRINLKAEIKLLKSIANEVNEHTFKNGKVKGKIKRLCKDITNDTLLREEIKDINQQEEAPSLAVLKKKIKSGTKLGSTETASAKARGLIPRADGTKRKSPKYK